MTDNSSISSVFSIKKDPSVLAAFDVLGFGVVIIDAMTHQIAYLNKRAATMSGHDAEELIGQSCHNLLCPSDYGNCPISDCGQRIDNSERSMLTTDNKTLPIIKTVIPATIDGHDYFIESLADYSAQKAVQQQLEAANKQLHAEIAQRQKIQDRLRDLARHDILTNLPNKQSFFTKLQQTIYTAQKDNSKVAVIFMDLDRFKMVNDTVGHIIGDQLLISVARRLEDNLREGDFVARFGGDEFVIMLNNIDIQETLDTIIARLIRMFHEPFHVYEHVFFITPSVGVALYPENGSDAATLVKCADIAMYKAKSSGRNQWFFCTENEKNSVAEWMTLSTQLHQALQKNEFVLFYQPQIDCRSERIIGAEALIRWNHPQYGLIPPGKFIPIAEQTGIIHALGAWVLRTACQQIKQWQKQGLPPLKVAINLSVVQFNNPDIVQQITSIAMEEGVDMQLLELELTESVTANNISAVVRKMQEFKECGLSLSIDDFGTYYSSLSYLKQFPVDKIKIAMPFVQGIGSDTRDEAIIKAIIVLGKSLGMCVIAEGVDQEQQLSFLRQQSCDEIQGYYYYKPLPPNELKNILIRQNKD